MKAYLNGIWIDLEAQIRAIKHDPHTGQFAPGPHKTDIKGTPDHWSEVYKNNTYAGIGGTKIFNAWKKKLSPDEVAAADHYTRSGYAPLNEGLRKHKGVLPSNHEKHDMAKHLDSALAKSGGAPTDLVVTRLVSGSKHKEHSHTGELFHHSQFKPGDVYQDHGFMSTSLPGGHYHESGWSAYAPDDFKLVIRVPKGTPGALLKSTHARYHKEQQEFLLARGTKLKILKVVHHKDISGLTSSRGIEVHAIVTHE